MHVKYRFAKKNEYKIRRSEHFSFITLRQTSRIKLFQIFCKREDYVRHFNLLCFAVPILSQGDDHI